MTDFALPSQNTDLASFRRYGMVGLFAVVVLFGGFTYWAATTELSGAVAAPGTVVVDGFAKRLALPGYKFEVVIRHRIGGRTQHWSFHEAH